MKLLRSLDLLFVRIETIVLVLCLSAMILLSFAQVMMRNFLGTGFLWADPLVRHLVIWAGFAGAAVATHEERHIGIDALTKFFSPRMKSATHLLTSLFAVVVCYFLADAALVFLLDEKEYGGDFMLSIPTWVALIIIPSGYAVMAMHFAIKIVEHLMTILGKEASE